MAKRYTRAFFEQRRELTRKSAEIILGLLFEKVAPRSVIDLGCATGTWLATCGNHGVGDYLGIDGSWVDTELLEIDIARFEAHDLGSNHYRPVQKYDLALCIEVAEHLSPDMGHALIESLTRASDVVLFSAAVKGQGGTGHINEQPQHYWASRFAEYDYVCVDLIRPAIWENDAVNVIYKQNMLLYVSGQKCRELGLEPLVISGNFEMDRIHPDLLYMRSTRVKDSWWRRWAGRFRSVAGRIKR